MTNETLNKMCYNKTRYKNEFVAHAVIGKLITVLKDKPEIKIAKRVYQCPICRGWHLTSK